MKKLRVGILISGGGTNMQAIVNACRDGKIDAEVVFVGADNPDARGLSWAEKKQIPTFVVNYEDIKNNALSIEESPIVDYIHFVVYEKSVFVHNWFGGDEKQQLHYLRWKVEAEKQIVKKAKEAKIDLLVLAGFMQICTSHLIDSINCGDDNPRIMNIHPALLPSFPGVNGYGDTLNYGCKVGGCTVHFIDYGEDTGPIIGQRTIPILPEDDEDSLKKKGLQEEYLLYPECIQLFAESKLSLEVFLSGDKKKRKVVKISN